MIIKNLKLGLILLVPVFFISCSTERELDNIFYCFNNGVSTLPNAPVGLEAQAALVKKLGYDGLAGHTEDNYHELRDAMDKVELERPEMYIAMNIVDGKMSYHEAL